MSFPCTLFAFSRREISTILMRASSTNQIQPAMWTHQVFLFVSRVYFCCLFVICVSLTKCVSQNSEVGADGKVEAGLWYVGVGMSILASVMTNLGVNTQKFR